MRRIVHPLGYIQPSLFDRITEITTDPTTGATTTTAVDLNDAEIDGVRLILRPVADEDNVVDDAMEILAGSNGEVRYDWLADQVDTEGDFIAYEVIDYADATSQPLPTFIITFKSPGDIEAAVDTAGPCSSWISGDEAMTCLTADVVIPDLLDYAVAMASSVLFDLSGRQFPNQCQRIVRPCFDPCSCGWGQVLSRGHLVGWDAGHWVNDCGDRCGCGITRRVRLAGIPVLSVEEVKLDGAVLDAAEYRLDAGGWLSRVDSGWPICQATSLPDTEPGTFSVSYTWGARPPLAGREAAKALAAEFYLACNASTDCVLPDSVQSVTRQGISYVRQEMSTEGALGVPAVDLFLSTYNPKGLRRRPAVWSPDIQQPARRY